MGALGFAPKGGADYICGGVVCLDAVSVVRWAAARECRQRRARLSETARAVLGIDVGTTGVKAVVVDDAGVVLADADAEQPLSVPRPGWAEQDPELWWTSTRQAVATAMAELRRLPRSVEIGAVGLSGQMHSSVFLDDSCEVIRPALLWADTRTTEQCREITETLGLSGLRRTVGNRALEGFTAPKVLWLRQHEPDSYERLRRLLLPKDYIRYRLTGELATDPSDAAGTLLYDVRERRWSAEALDALDVDVDILPEVVDSADVSGCVSVGAAETLGLQAGLPVVGGGADNAAGAVGSGVVGPGTVQSSIGTSGTMLMPAASPLVDGEMRLHTFCHCVPDRWYLMGVVLSAGNAMRWLRDVLLEGGSYETLTAEAEDVPPGSDGLYFLPYLTGERTPHNDSAARGVFFGLHLGHTRAHMVRAVMEGVCFALRDSLELMRPFAEEIGQIRAIGGGARSRLWRQMQADVFGASVAGMGDGGGPAYGAAALAAVGAGMFDSVAETIDAWVSTKTVSDPNPAGARVYDELYEEWRELYPSLKTRFASAAALAERLGSRALSV